MWPIQLAFLLLISYRIFLCSLTLSNTSSFLAWSVQMIKYLTLLQFQDYWILKKYTQNNRLQWISFYVRNFKAVCMIYTPLKMTLPPVETPRTHPIPQWQVSGYVIFFNLKYFVIILNTISAQKELRIFIANTH
jgi:hypothetical protein